jgi:hypothetical protein
LEAPKTSFTPAELDHDIASTTGRVGPDKSRIVVFVCSLSLGHIKRNASNNDSRMLLLVKFHGKDDDEIFIYMAILKTYARGMPLAASQNKNDS